MADAHCCLHCKDCPLAHTDVPVYAVYFNEHVTYEKQPNHKTMICPRCKKAIDAWAGDVGWEALRSISMRDALEGLMEDIIAWVPTGR